MENLKNIFGKNVIALNLGENIGYILNVAFDEGLKKVLGYIVCDNESEEEFFLDLKAVKAESEAGVLVDSAMSLCINDTDCSNPFGKMVLSDDGEPLGTVIDIVIRKNNVEKIITTKGEIFPKNIEIVGKNYVIFSKNKKKRKNIIRIKSTVSLPKVEILSQKKAQATLPARAYVTPSRLLSKCATIDIFGLNNELIIKKGEKITQEKINKAKKHNKLNYLIFNSK